MIHVADGAAQEREKYAEIWSLQEYRDAHSPGLENVDRFMSVMNPQLGSSIIDIGCGSAGAAVAFNKRGLQSWAIDITDAGLVEEFDRSKFIESTLWAASWKQGYYWQYGFCCDVLEHIPPEYALLVCDRILENCGVAWLQISNQPDNFGPKLLGEPLHLTVRPYSWWLLRLATLGKVLDARDLCGVSLFVVTR